jgi:cytochrome c-type biogenesis protein CcmH/NrfG
MIAREALQRAPRNARALTLVGRVLSWGPEGRAKAHKAFSNALTVDPTSEEAVIGLAELLVVESKIPDALQLLSSQVQQRSTEALHLKLAEVLVAAGNNAEALIHLHIALGKNPHSTAARDEIDRIDRIVKGGEVAESDGDPDVEPEGDSAEMDGY